MDIQRASNPTSLRRLHCLRRLALGCGLAWASTSAQAQECLIVQQLQQAAPDFTQWVPGAVLPPGLAACRKRPMANGSQRVECSAPALPADATAQQLAQLSNWLGSCLGTGWRMTQSSVGGLQTIIFASSAAALSFSLTSAPEADGAGKAGLQFAAQGRGSAATELPAVPQAAPEPPVAPVPVPVPAAPVPVPAPTTGTQAAVAATPIVATQAPRTMGWRKDLAKHCRTLKTMLASSLKNFDDQRGRAYDDDSTYALTELEGTERCRVIGKTPDDRRLSCTVVQDAQDRGELRHAMLSMVSDSLKCLGTGWRQRTRLGSAPRFEHDITVYNAVDASSLKIYESVGYSDLGLRVWIEKD